MSGDGGGESNLACENNIGKVVANFNVGDGNEDINLEGDMNNIEVIEILKDEVPNDKERVNENKENRTSKNFKDYIEICNLTGVIPTWMGFERYTQIKKREAQP